MAKRKKHLINTNIRSTDVRLVGDGESRVIKTYDAIKIAESEGMDLIVINNNQCPPIAKIEEYSKFLYKEGLEDKKRKSNTDKTVIKEIRLSPEIGDNDLMTKAKKGAEFLKKGFKVKCNLMLKGRQKYNPERGEIIILKFAEILEDDGIVESFPKLQGNK